MMFVVILFFANAAATISSHVVGVVVVVVVLGVDVNDVGVDPVLCFCKRCCTAFLFQWFNTVSSWPGCCHVEENNCFFSRLFKKMFSHLSCLIFIEEWFIFLFVFLKICFLIWVVWYLLKNNLKVDLEQNHREWQSAIVWDLRQMGRFIFVYQKFGYNHLLEDLFVFVFLF